jgi:xanthine dehydrogenase molybdenum-binding subunit
VDETTAAEAIELIRVDLEPLPFAINPLDSLRPGWPERDAAGQHLHRRESRS